MDNERVLLWLFLLVSLLFLSHCSCLLCPPTRRSQGELCECAESRNGYQLFCPQQVEARVHLVWREEEHGQGEVLLTCIEEVSSQDMIRFLEGHKMENLSKMSLERCPVSKEILQELVLSEVEGTLDILVLEDIAMGPGFGSYSWFDWDGLRSVTHLEILYSDGLRVGADMFKYMIKLETVIFRDNTNTVVEDKAFLKLEDLRNLELSKCDINQLKVNSFVNLRKLKKLQLDSNYIKSLPAGIFRDLESLEELNLSLNRLESLPDEILGNLKQLERINLNYNQLTALPGEVFKNTSKLKRLEISNNALSAIPSNIIKTLKNLKFLDLSSNQLTKLDRIIFQVTQKLAHLHLQHNQLTRINLSNLGHRNSVLASLDLSHNLLVSADIGSGIFSKLSTINMSSNRIRGAFTGTLTINCMSLKYLDLSHNSYNGTIKKKHLDVFKRNLTLNLSHNGISRVDMAPPRYARYMLSSSNYHTEVMLEGNPMVCDCFSSELKQRLQGNPTQQSGLVFQDFSCEDSTSLSRWEYQDLNCAFPGYGYTSAPCTDNCLCYYNKFYKRVTLDCEARNMTAFPQILSTVRDTDSVRLNLKHNWIETIGDEIENITNFELVEYIDLSDNIIEDINHNFLPAGLKYLILFDNNITNFSKETLEYLENATRSDNLTLQLGQNPFSCDCSSSPFYHFLQHYGNTSVKDFLNISIVCPQELLPLFQADMQDFCSSLTSYVPYVFIFFAPIIVMVMVLLCYGNRRNITIWLFSKPWARHLFSEDLTDNDKEYDAFISYSHHDAQFVEQTLYPGLVTPNTSTHAPYKCCIHTLHWQVGRMIPDQIVESVANSRRTIIILSKGYIEAVWTKLEFRAAHKQALQDRTQRIILIIHGSLPPVNTLDKDLQRYIRLNTYLSTDDKYFWSKLRYALPHPGKINSFQNKKNVKKLEKNKLQMRIQAGLQLEINWSKKVDNSE